MTADFVFVALTLVAGPTFFAGADFFAAFAVEALFAAFRKLPVFPVILVRDQVRPWSITKNFSRA